jgi:Spy/CpxP family protein refolding chaperone
VRRFSAFIAVMCFVCGSAIGWAASQQPRPGSPPPPPAPTVDDAVKAVRSDLHTTRAAIISKNVTFTPEQAARFWPLFESYQKEQGRILDDQLRGIQQYIETYQTLDDTAALALMNAHLDRDARINALRQTWLAEFLKVLPARLAVRVIQIDRRVSLAQQVEFMSKIPLVQ